MTESSLRIDGMHCGSCVRRVSQALAGTPGVVVKEVRVGAARFSAAADVAPPDEVIAAAIEAVAKAGYSAHLES